jgi:hypothetical protein
LGFERTAKPLMEEKKLDLEQFASEAYRQVAFSEHQLSITPRKDRAEVDADLEIKKADSEHQRHKDLLLLRAALTAVFLLIGTCVWVILSKGLSGEDGKLALSTLVAIIGTLLGYFTGKASK